MANPKHPVGIILQSQTTQQTQISRGYCKATSAISKLHKSFICSPFHSNRFGGGLQNRKNMAKLIETGHYLNFMNFLVIIFE